MERDYLRHMVGVLKNSLQPITEQNPDVEVSEKGYTTFNGLLIAAKEVLKDVQNIQHMTHVTQKIKGIDLLMMVSVLHASLTHED